ncbi:hypothetical protein ANO11243_084840 [Dothideomycetidae sp. 11243]|nr:hypothetical protein ANO11243_084840 [fungal sp. No.11243]
MGNCYSAMERGPIDTNYIPRKGESQQSIAKNQKKLLRAERHRKQNAYAEQMCGLWRTIVVFVSARHSKVNAILYTMSHRAWLFTMFRLASRVSSRIQVQRSSSINLARRYTRSRSARRGRNETLLLFLTTAGITCKQ